MTYHGIELDTPEINALCREHGMARLALFGSVLRDDFGPASDVDVLVEFEPGRTPGIMAMATLEQELGALLGRRVDLRTPAELGRHIREQVLREAVTQYAQA